MNRNEIGAASAIGAIVASGGVLAASLLSIAAGAGFGGMIGGLLARAISEDRADYIQRQLEHRGLLLWVRTWNADNEKNAVKIPSRHSAHDVHLLDLPAA